jgi:YegS/Rv2252/BmrU family lipid kinase
MPTAMLAYNPTAGRYPSGILAERAAAVLQTYGWRVQLETTQDAAHITSLARQSANQGMEAFFMAGGDGSINNAIEGLLGSETALGVLPAGTANVWAQELGLPGLSWTRWLALEESAHQLAKGRICQVDVGFCNDHPFLLWAGVGLDAFIVHHIEPRTQWEKHFAAVHYTALAVWHASYWHGMNLKVEADGREVKGHFLLAVVSNVHLYAGGYAELSPRACLDDGQMDLWLFEGETLGNTVQLAWDMLSGRHLESGRMHHLTFQSLHMEADSPVYLQVDGEPLAADGAVEVSITPRALRILAPQQTPRPLLLADYLFDGNDTLIK